MADNITLNNGSGGAVCATDDIGGVHHQYVKVEFGAADSATPVSTANGLPVDLRADNVGLALEAGGNLAGAATSLAILDDWDESDRAKVNLIAAQAGVTGGAGAVAANTPRVTLASDDPGVALLGTIDADTSTLAGAVAGSEMQVDVVAALPTGSNAIGKLAANSGVDIGDVDVLTIANMHSADFDSGAGTDTTLAVGIAVPASGGAAVVPGDATNGLTVNLGSNNDVTVTGSVTANAGTNLNTSALALEAGGNLAGAATSLAIIDDWDETNRCAVNLISGAAAITGGAGAVAANTPRVTLASDDPAVALLGTIDSDTSSLAASVHAEDTAHSTGHSGIMALCVQQTADAALAGTTGDYAPPQVDENGFLKVNVKASIGGGTTDDGAFTAGTGTGIPIMGFATSDTVDAGDVGALAMDTARNLKVSIEVDNVGIGGGTQYTEDAAAAGDPVGNALIMVRDDALSGQTTADGDNVAARGTDKGELYIKHVDAIPVTDNSGALTIDWNGTAPPIGAGVEATALRVTLATDSTGVVSVDDNGGALTVDGTVTANAGTNLNTSALALESGGNLAGAATSLAAIDDWDESDRAKVNLIAGQAGITAGAGAVGASTPRITLASDDPGVALLGTIDSDTSTLAGAVSGSEMQVDVVSGTITATVVGSEAHDAAATAAPLIAAGVAQDSDDTAPPNRVSAEGDVAQFATDFDGALFVRPHGPQVWDFHSDGSTALTDEAVHTAPGAGLSIYVTDIVFSSGAATAINLFFEESTTTVLGPYYLEAVAGRGMAIHFNTPKKITANTALTCTTSASIAHSVDVTGFIGQG